jgi:transposase
MGIEMSKKGIKRHEVVTLIEAGVLRQKAGAKRLDVSERQMKRIMQRYRAEGAEGLNRRRSGKTAGNRIEDEVRHQVQHLSASRYQGLGPTLVAEKLKQEQGLRLSVETVRQIMMDGGSWQAKRGKDVKRHPIRERRARFGELIQIDGSPHDWFEGRSVACTLLVFIDDATGRLTQLRFVPTETTLGYMACLHGHIQSYGLPMALYSDRHSIFRVNGESEGETQWGRAMSDLGIEQICANSPQAKGRVERVNQTLQDRLVKEMRLQGIDDMTAANRWLPQYIATFNQRFAVAAKSPEDAHVAWMDAGQSLREILSQHEERTLSKEMTISYCGRCLQITHTSSGRGLRQAKVKIHEHFDGTLEIRRQGHLFAYQEIAKPKRQGQIKDSKEINQHLDVLSGKRYAHTPTANPPWRGARRDGAALQATGLRPAPSATPHHVTYSKTRANLTTAFTATTL